MGRFITFCFPKGKPNKNNPAPFLSNARPARLTFHPRVKRLINLPMSSGPADSISQFPAVPGNRDIDSRPLKETGYFVVVELENDKGGAGATRGVHTMVLTGDIKIRPPQAIDTCDQSPTVFEPSASPPRLNCFIFRNSRWLSSKAPKRGMLCR